LDALRRKPHPTHSSLEESLALVERLQPRQAFFTHIAHELGHRETSAMLPPHVCLAYDGLTIDM
jgi:phosphoribosyl 1,2-cyclic phosphate phosphodiesterase